MEFKQNRILDKPNYDVPLSIQTKNFGFKQNLHLLLLSLCPFLCLQLLFVSFLFSLKSNIRFLERMLLKSGIWN